MSDRRRSSIIITSSAFLLTCWLLAAPVAGEYRRGDPCYTQPGYHFHKDEDGNTRCCKTVQCSPGSKPVICERVHGEASCQMCGEGLVQKDTVDSHQDRHCYIDTWCLETGRAIVDGKCVCDTTQGYFPYQDYPRFCNRKMCPKGHEVNNDGTCVGCPYGFFKSEEGFTNCMQWTYTEENCRHYGGKFTAGTTTWDSVCLRKGETLPPIQTDTPTTTGKPTPVPVIGPTSPTVRYVTKKEKSTSGTDMLTLITVLVILVILLVVSSVLLAYCFIQRRRSNKDKASQLTPSSTTSTSRDNSIDFEANAAPAEDVPLVREVHHQRLNQGSVPGSSNTSGVFSGATSGVGTSGVVPGGTSGIVPGFPPPAYDGRQTSHDLSAVSAPPSQVFQNCTFNGPTNFGDHCTLNGQAASPQPAQPDRPVTCVPTPEDGGNTAEAKCPNGSTVPCHANAPTFPYTAPTVSHNAPSAPPANPTPPQDEAVASRLAQPSDDDEIPGGVYSQPHKAADAGEVAEKCVSAAPFMEADHYDEEETSMKESFDSMDGSGRFATNSLRC